MDQTKLAAAAAGAAVGSVALVLFKAPLWAGLLLGSAGAYLTYVGVNKAAGA